MSKKLTKKDSSIVLSISVPSYYCAGPKISEAASMHSFILSVNCFHLAAIFGAMI